MSYTIIPYESRMIEQVSKMFENQYGIKASEFKKLMLDFYEHPFQKNKCIRVVANEGEKIIGFQSFFYWPYIKSGKTYNSFQSGNSLVHPDYRGKGIFQNLLKSIEETSRSSGVDFLLGFPVEASYKSFIKTGWNNLLNLNWFVKIVNPLGFLFGDGKLQHYFSHKSSPVANTDLTGQFQLDTSSEFNGWRNNYSSNKDYYYYTYNENNKHIEFHLKFNKRNRLINELIIGRVTGNSNDIVLIKKAFRHLKRKANASRCISILSIAINTEANDNFSKYVSLSGFFTKTKKQIYFITKNFINDKEIDNIKNWTLYRNDIDTW